MTKLNPLRSSLLVLPLLTFLIITSLANAVPPTTQASQLTLDEAAAECQNALASDQCPPAVLPICQQAADQAESTLGKMNEKTAKMLWNLGECFSHNGKSKDAEIAILKSLYIRMTVLGKEHRQVAESLNSLGVILKDLGRYAEAESVHGKALAIERKRLGSEHVDVALVITNLASTLALQGKLSEAEQSLRQSLAMIHKALAGDHLHVAQVQNALAVVLERQGKYAEAESLHRLSLAILRKLRGSDHLDVSTSLNNIAMTLRGQGKYSEAEKIFRQALSSRQKILGLDHPDMATGFNNLAIVLHSQGKYSEAEQLYRRALLIRQKFLDAEHPHIAQNINNIAAVLRYQGKYREAQELHNQAIVMQQKLLGIEHPDVATSMHNLASTLEAQGKYTEAESLSRHALSIQQKHLDSEHPEIAHGLDGLAVALSRQGRYLEAEPVARQSLAIRRKRMGPEHPRVAVTLCMLARILVSIRRYHEPISLFQEAVIIREQQIRTTFSETRIQATLDSFGRQEQGIYDLLLGPRNPMVTALALRVALLRKGRAAEAGALANRLIHRNLGRPEVKQRFDAWVSVRQQREFLLLGGMGKRKSEEYQKQLQDLQFQAESLEHLLAVEVPEIRDVQPPPFEEIIAKVAQRLPPDGVLIEVVEAKPHHGGRSDSQLRGANHFIALLLFPDQRVDSVDLGEVKSIDVLAKNLRRALASSLSHPEPAAQALYTALFDKLREHLGGRKDIYLSLEGSLNLVPFDALHDGNDYLVGHYRFHYLTSGRDLLRKPSNQPVGPAVVLGNPYFGPDSVVGMSEESNVYAKLASLANLPWAQREVEVVAKLLDVRPLLGAEAKEDVLRGRVAPWVLHLATHGIYLSDLSPWQIPGGDRSALLPLQMPGEGPDPNGSPPQRLPGEFGPMNRSGLLFAGVRQGVSVEDKTKDGLLTAEEAHSLDLDGTQLVVLSACDSGMGETAPGQGVYGLRRAFLIAGAETLVTSLWRVDDEATGELMALYYQKLLDKQRPGNRLGAMLESMQELRTRPGRSHPYYWAPFLVIGADGPLTKPTTNHSTQRSSIGA